MPRTPTRKNGKVRLSIKPDAGEDLKIAETKRVVCELRRQGLSYREIAAHPLVTITKSHVARLIDQVKKELLDEAKKALEQVRAEELDGYGYLERLMMEDYAKSGTDFSETLTEGSESGPGTLPRAGDAQVKGAGAKKAQAKYRINTKTKHHARYRDPRIAANIIHLKRLRAEVAGLVSKDVQQQDGATVNIFIPHNSRDDKPVADVKYEPPEPKQVPAVVSPLVMAAPMVEPLPPPTFTEPGVRNVKTKPMD